ncbi:helix-turn-helix domain-containing protein [Planococcus sp. A6]|uniref:helix-turn-helix domain-containing protein n=1 Tax=Planococcus sp. A6 TaxID=2992760 RepID=UPI00237AC3DF|nr:helix-turn-helix transcriptional regulator [Planococcus sp. A6]
MLSQRMKNLRSKSKMTQSELAKILGVARTTYAMYEQGQREPDYVTLQKIADYFDVSVDYLLGREEKKSPSWNHNPEFEEFLNDPKISKLYSEYKESSEERREALFAAWEYLKSLDKK